MTLDFVLPLAIVKSLISEAFYNQMLFGASTGPIYMLVNLLMSRTDIGHVCEFRYWGENQH